MAKRCRVYLRDEDVVKLDIVQAKMQFKSTYEAITACVRAFIDLSYKAVSQDDGDDDLYLEELFKELFDYELKTADGKPYTSRKKSSEESPYRKVQCTNYAKIYISKRLEQLAQKYSDDKTMIRESTESPMDILQDTLLSLYYANEKDFTDYKHFEDWADKKFNLK